VEKTIELLKKEIEEAIKEQAQVIVLGCTGLAGFATKLQKFFKVPILDPAECAAKILENVVEIRKRF